FIGSPSMNFFDGTLVGEEGNLYVDTGDFRVKVPSDRKPVYNSYIGKEVVFGMRPEHVRAPQYAPPNIAAEPVEATVEIVELLGHELHLFMNSGKYTFVGTVDTRMDVSSGNRVGLVFDMNNMHLFDKNTEQAIR
ncbi:MAG: TOBE domain-containing protein, partial [Anaerolineales bacterium]|nr:TOBE domain-containing protein [Anaerolineales bacterium]